MEEISDVISSFSNVKCSKCWLNQFEIIGTETVKALYSVLKPLLTVEAHKNFFDDVLLPNWTSFASFEDSKMIFLPIENPNSDFRMNERIFKYEESEFKEQNLKQLAEEGLYYGDNHGKKSKQALISDKQQKCLNSYVDSVKIMPPNLTTNISSFDILQQNEGVYMNLGQQLGENIPQDHGSRETFIKNLEDHLVDIEAVNTNIALETRRSNYTHRKKSKPNSELIQNIRNKKRDIKLKTVQEVGDQDAEMEEDKQPTPTEKVNTQLQSIDLSEPAPEKQPNKRNQKRKEIQRDQIVLLLVFNKSPNGFGDSISIFIESGYSLGLLRRFSYSGSKAIGLKEYKLINIERETPLYPYDYPSTSAYSALSNTLSQTALLSYCKKPPSKRINYYKLNSPHPFKSHWDPLQAQLCQIFITSPARTPGRLFYICLPIEKDLEEKQKYPVEPLVKKLTKTPKFSPKDFNKAYEGIFKEKVYPATVGVKDKFKELMEVDSKEEELVLKRDSLEVNTGVQMSRRIIGYVTSGGYSMKRGHGVGIAVVDRGCLETVGVGGYVLVRNPASRQYFKAKVQRVF